MSEAISGKSIYPTIPLDNVILPVQRLEVPSLGKTYRLVGVKLWGEGAYERESIDGSQTQYKTLSRVEANDIIINKIWARNGSVGVISPSLAGCYGSNEFPTFTAIQEKLEPRWFHWMTKTRFFWNQCDEKSRGTSGQNRIRPEKFLEILIPLPPLAEQRRVVTRIEKLAAKVEEARGLRSESVREARLLLECANSHILDSDEWQVNRLETVLAEPPRNGLSPQRVVESDGKQMLRINAVSSTLTRYVDLSIHKLVDVADDVAQPFTLRNDDVFIVRYNGDINRLAKAAIFKSSEPLDVIYPDKLMRLRADPTKILPDFLVYALGSRRVRNQIKELGITTAGQIGISGKNAKSFLISVPPIPEQRRIVSYLDAIQAKVDALKQLQCETEIELNALLPSILNKAFKGEL